MFSRSTFLITLTAILLLFAPLLVVGSAVPEAGRTLAVLLPPWMGYQAQLSVLAGTGVALVDGGHRLAGLGPHVWMVRPDDAESARRLSLLPGLTLSGAIAGCGTQSS
ncbi:hypothetical protein [Niveispirillum sp. KHB5.9]|uniref:hypothetical protein n=1 Tax=Niveispirillum sp. KHB5.9 TaxID=3400269 RepID=UPI003A8372DD